MYKLAIAAMLLCILFPATVQAAYIINPGQSHNCTVAGEIVNCGSCSNVTTNETIITGDTCNIQKTLAAGETIELTEAPCNVKVSCEYSEPNMDNFEYTIINYLEKRAGLDVTFGILIEDEFGHTLAEKDYDYDYDDVASIEFRHNFTCPGTIVFEEVNAESCSEFFEQYYETKDPLSMMLAADNTEYRDLLLACQGNLSANKDLMNQYKDLYTDMQSKNNELKNKNIELNNTMNSMDRDYKIDYKEYVPGMWQIAAVLELLVIVAIAVVLIYSKSEGVKL